ncbi:PRC-barrel domain-containing protein [Methylobacterium sp. J-068]|uniref:PRC-barrel domain-containing protein n=1 Tax=Methylobacterium sp. J-068 TaxID=2836649 RepID=UPI001FBAF156|nr:PRC-barrel domain-containing protein [Methylobacterium sp. J-068]MCJ2036288.1 PRC-barrel domain-containing protein [Methylobacterium sp. J-068]
MIATATITLWAAAAAAEGPATPGKEPAAGAGDVTTGSPASGAPPAAPASAPPPATAPVQGPGTASQPAPAGTTGTPATVLDTQDYEGVLGKAVRSSTGEDMGRIIDIILDKDGRPRAAIIDFGGFLGVGSRKIAVDWRAMRFTSDGKPSRLVLQLSRNQVRVSPEYKPGDPIVVLGPASPAAPGEGEQAAAPVQGPAVPAQGAPPQAAAPAAAAPAAPTSNPAPAPAPNPAPASSPAPAPSSAPVAQPEKTPDKPAERSPDR